MDDRSLRFGSLFEWVAAALCVLLLVWVISVPVQRFVGSGLQAAISEIDVEKDTPPGVPPGATKIPVMLLLDGRELRQGDPYSRLDAVLPATLADGPARLSHTPIGDRHTRAYVVHGVKFYVVCEQLEPNGPMRVSGIYLP